MKHQKTLSNKDGHMALLSRLRFTTTNAWQHRKALHAANQQRIDSVNDLNFEELKAEGIKTFIFDYDGVLVSHGEVKLAPEIENTLHSAIKTFGVNHVFILSNNVFKERLRYFDDRFPGLKFVGGKRKKPYPDGLQEILQITQNRPEEALLVDDRLLTGGLACCITGVKFLLLTYPLINFKRRFLRNCFFQILRKVERWIL
ncbi:MAG: YqeG family HAD IIIA-type phosphatase [Gammaproteobacteria bacterium]